MAQTAARRPSPLRESSYPSPSSPISIHQTVELPTAGPSTNRPRSIINRILRTSVVYTSFDSGTTIDSTRESITRLEKKDKNKWEKRASRKAPPPPSKNPVDFYGDSESPRRATMLVDIASNRGRKGSMYTPKEEEEFGGFDSMDRLGEDRDFEMILPNVVLHPPEEEDTSPIKLYPPPPPNLPRPPLIHLKESSSRPNSIHSIDTTSDNSSINGHRNVWGGMSKGFGKPPPTFKRATRALPSGVIMPKKREQVVRERERRLSMYNPEEMDWRLGEVQGNETFSPPRRVSSPPTIESSTLGHPPSVPFIPERDLASDRPPPRIMITSDSLASLTTETAHSSEMAEGDGDYAIDPSANQDNVSSEILGMGEVVQSPVSMTAPSLPTVVRHSDSHDDTTDVKQTVESHRQEFLEGTDDKQASYHTDAHSQSAQITDNNATYPEPPISTSVSVPKKSSTVPLPESVQPQADTASSARKRRSMSLTSILQPKPVDVVPPLPQISLQKSEKVIRKHKSLKKFFFSNHTPDKEHDPLPKLDKLVKEREGPNFDTWLVKIDKELKEEPVKPRTGFGMLTRPKSKPSLRIDVKASREVPVSGPSTASSRGSEPAFIAAPLSANSTSTSTSEPYPETPTSSSGRSNAKSQTPMAGANTPKGLTKRFSLSNMSAAFKRSKKDTVSIPQVPEVPLAYKKEKPKKSMSDEAPRTSDETKASIKESAVPLSPRSGGRVAGSPDTHRPLLSPPPSPGQNNVIKGSNTPDQGATTRAPLSQSVPPSPKDTLSLVSDTSSAFELDAELNHAQLMLVSPRTRRNPAESLQDIMGTAPISRQSKIIKLDAALSRRSVETVILGPLLLSPEPALPDGVSALGLNLMETIPDEEVYFDVEERRESDGSGSLITQESSNEERRFDSETSLDSLSRSSSTCEQTEGGPITPLSLEKKCIEGSPKLGLLPALPLLELSRDKSQSQPLESGDIEMGKHPLGQGKKGSTAEGIWNWINSTKESPRSILFKLKLEKEKESQKGQDTSLTSDSLESIPIPIPIPPVPLQDVYSSLEAGVQLRSLHFDSLGLDFDGLFPVPSVPSTG